MNSGLKWKKTTPEKNEIENSDAQKISESAKNEKTKFENIAAEIFGDEENLASGIDPPSPAGLIDNDIVVAYRRPVCPRCQSTWLVERSHQGHLTVGCFTCSRLLTTEEYAYIIAQEFPQHGG